AGNDGLVRLWDTATGQVLHTFTGHSLNVFAGAHSPDGRLLASGGRDGRVRLWDVGPKEERLSFLGPPGGIFDLGLAPGGRALAVSYHDRVVSFRTARDPELPGAEMEKAALRWHQRVANDSLEDGHWFAAVFHLDRLLAARPEDGTAYALRGHAHVGLGKWSE